MNMFSCEEHIILWCTNSQQTIASGVPSISFLIYVSLSDPCIVLKQMCPVNFAMPFLSEILLLWNILWYVILMTVPFF